MTKANPAALLAIATVLAACTQSAPTEPPDVGPSGHIESRAFDDHQIVYLKAEDMLATWPTETVGGRQYWSPTPQDGSAAYAALKTYLHRPDVGLREWQEAARQRVAKTLGAYSFRISGVMIAPAGGGQARAVVNLEGVCEDAARETNWRAPDYAVLDGGVCFFDAYYDPASKAIVGFAAHGPA